MKKKIISLAVVVLLAVSYLTVLAVANTGIETENGVITAELQSVMDSATTTAKIPVSIWTTEVDTAVVEEIALAKSGYNKDSIRALVDQGKIDTVTLEDVDKYIAAERRIYAQLQQQAHQAFVEDYEFLKTASTAEGAYMCSYAPMMIVELTTSQIETLAKDSYVNTMYYSPELEVQDEMNISLPTIWADYTRNTGGLDGTGIRIGMVEGGVPDNDFQLSFFDSEGNRRIFLHPLCTSETEHATAVAEIMISDGTYTGIAPNAKLYCASMSELGFYQAVEWLIQQNVHVINMSAATVAGGTYSESDKWVDHIANNHSVHFIKSAGNTSDKVTSPGLAYNAITVGAIDDRDTVDWSGDVKADFSAFNEVTSAGVTPTNKPEIMAPGVLIRTSSFPNAVFPSGLNVSGTSFAAPHVTGVVAQLIQQMPALATLQDLMKAILTASISHSEHQYDSGSTTEFVENYERCGAGVVNAQDCTYTNYRGTFASATIPASAPGDKATYTFTASSSDSVIRISLAWLYNVLYSSPYNHETTSPDITRTLADLDLIVYDPNGNLLTACNSINESTNNLVVLQFDPAEHGYGTYTVVIKQKNTTNASTYYGLVWW